MPEDAAMPEGHEEPRPSLADELLDELLPEGLDWRRLVRNYPIPALIVSGLGGLLLGRSHGTAIVEALSGFASREVDRTVSAFLGDDGAGPRG